MTKKYSSTSPWASDDDASNLLGSILDDTRDAALAETKELARAVEARLQADELARHQAREARQADTASRLEQEAERQVKLERRRTAAMQAITAADAPPQVEPQPIAPAYTPQPAPMDTLPEIAVEPLAPIIPLPEQVGAPAPNSTVLLSAIAAAAVVVIGVTALLVALMMPGYTPDQTPYPKIVMHPTVTRDLVTGEAFRPVPEEEEAPAAVVEAPGERTNTRKPGGKRPGKKPRPAKPSKPSMDNLFGDDSDDIFGTMDKSGK